MINQVGSNNSIRAFSDFSQPKNGYVIVPEQQNENDAVQINDKKHHKINGKAVAGSAIILGFLTLGLTKGVMPKSFTKLLDKWKIALEKKVSPDKNTKNIYNYLLDKLNLLRDRFESINNFTTIKDVLFQRVMYGKNGQRTFTRKIHEGITKVFNRMSRNTVNSSYAHTQKKFATLNEYLLALNEKLLKNSNNPDTKALIETIKLKISGVNQKFENGFGLNARNQRYEQMNRAYNGLFDYFWDSSLNNLRNLKSRHMWSSYIAEDYLYADKKAITKNVKLLRKAISNNIDNDYFTSIESIGNIKKYLNLKDIESRDIIQNLKDTLLKYKKLTGNTANQERTELRQNILSQLEKLSKSINSDKYSKETMTAITEQIKNIEEVISTSSKGEFQEILTLYKKILPEKEYKQLKSKMTQVINSLDESIDTETIKYFDKARDLKLGAAPTDVMSILVSAGTVAWLVGKSKDKDEVISASLKYGIPAVGTIATSLYCTTKLISGGKAFVLSMISGWIINRIGEFADNIRKQYSLQASVHRKKPTV